MKDVMSEIRNQYFELKKTFEEKEKIMKEKRMPIPPRGIIFNELQKQFEPTLVQDLLAENNDVPKNKGRT